MARRIKPIIYTISHNRWEPEGKPLRMNPLHSEIDKLFKVYRKKLKRLVRERFMKKDGPTFTPVLDRVHDSFSVLPIKKGGVYSFRLSDIVYAKWVMKNHKEMFLGLGDWNNLELLIRMLQRRKLKKPKLTAQLIFAAWCFTNPTDSKKGKR